MRFRGFFYIFFLFFLPFTAQSIQAEASQTYEVNADYLNMRKGPTIDSEVVGKLTYGNKVTIFHEKAGWGQTYFDGEVVWVASKFLTPITNEELPYLDGLLTGYSVVIDPGHGGKDPGAIGQNGVMEKDLILTTALKIAAQLRKAGAEVIMTREDDSFVSLQDRVYISNRADADAFISIHFNSFPEDYVGGINTYFYQRGRGLAEKIQTALAQEVPLRNRGVIQGNYRVLQENKHPAVLIELGFISNKSEVMTLQTESYQDKVARAITTGLAEYLLE